MYYIIFQPHPHPADDINLYKLVYKCIHSGIIHRAKTKSKYNLAQQSHIGTCFSLLGHS